MPRFVAPQYCHPFAVLWINVVQARTFSIPIYVSDRKIEEDFDRTHCAGSLENIPTDVHSVGIKETESTREGLEAESRENCIQKNRVAVTVMDRRVFLAGCNLS